MENRFVWLSGGGALGGAFGCGPGGGGGLGGCRGCCRSCCGGFWEEVTIHNDD